MTDNNVSIQYKDNNVIDNDNIDKLTHTNRSMIDTLIFISGLPKVNKKDIKSLEDRYRLCLEYCSSHNIKLLNKVVYSFLNLNREDVFKMEHGINTTEDINKFIKKVQADCAFFREFMIAEGNINPVVGIFWQKHYDGMIEVVNVNIDTSNSEGSVSREQLLEQYGTKAIESGVDVKDL